MGFGRHGFLGRHILDKIVAGTVTRVLARLLDGIDLLEYSLHAVSARKVNREGN